MLAYNINIKTLLYDDIYIHLAFSIYKQWQFCDIPDIIMHRA